jgi:Mrp family chromosome partitioning ATPase
MTSHFVVDPALDFSRSTRSPREVGDVSWRKPALMKLARALRRQGWVLAGLIAAGIGAGFIHSFLAAADGRLIIGAWIAAGLGAGLAAAAAREFARDAVDPVKLRRRLTSPVIGTAPAVAPIALRQLAPDKRSPVGLVIFQPAAGFATSMRDLQRKLGEYRVVSFIAPTAEAGATTTALCAAICATQQGRRVIVVDCDLRQRGLTKALGSTPERGALEASEQPDHWRDFAEAEEETGLHYLPAARPRNAWRSLLASGGFPALVERLRGAYDLVVLDCPPALGAAEGPYLARMADHAVMVAAWDETPFSALRAALRALRVHPGNVGVVVNRTPTGLNPSDAKGRT